MEKVIKPFTQFVQIRYKNQKLVGAEIGVREGNNAARLLNDLLFEQLHLVDIWGKIKQYVLFKDTEYTNVDHGWIYPNIVKRFGSRSDVAIHRMPSLDASKEFPNEHFDFVYIDACHSYEHVTEDISVWFPKVKVGGVFGGHDYREDRICPGVNRAVDEFIQNSGYELLQPTEPDWWIVK